MEAKEQIPTRATFKTKSIVHNKYCNHKLTWVTIHMPNLTYRPKPNRAQLGCNRASSREYSPQCPLPPYRPLAPAAGRPPPIDPHWLPPIEGYSHPEERHHKDHIRNRLEWKTTENKWSKIVQTALFSALCTNTYIALNTAV